MGMGVQRHAPAAVALRKRPGTHCIGSWVGPRVSMDRCRKCHPPQPEFDPRTVRIAAGRYTD